MSNQQQTSGIFSRPGWVALLLVVASLGTTTLRADDIKETERRLKNPYKNKVLTLRQFYQGNRLHFDADGTLMKGGKPGPWTLYGRIEVTDFRVRKNHWEVRGKRIYVAYDQKTNRIIHYHSRESVRVEVDQSVEQNPAATIQAGLRKIFLTAGDQLADVAPPYWRKFLQGDIHKELSQDTKSEIEPAAEKLNAIGVEIGENEVTVTEGVAVARRIHSVPPHYPVPARQAGIEGKVVLLAIIDRDGKIKDLHIVKARGMGLDDAAVEAVRQWKYTPVSLNDEPLEVETIIEATFRLR